MKPNFLIKYFFGICGIFCELCPNWFHDHRYRKKIGFEAYLREEL